MFDFVIQSIKSYKCLVFLFLCGFLDYTATLEWWLFGDGFPFRDFLPLWASECLFGLNIRLFTHLWTPTVYVFTTFPPNPRCNRSKWSFRSPRIPAPKKNVASWMGGNHPLKTPNPQNLQRVWRLWATWLSAGLSAGDSVTTVVGLVTKSLDSRSLSL